VVDKGIAAGNFMENSVSCSLCSPCTESLHWKTCDDRWCFLGTGPHFKWHSVCHSHHWTAILLSLVGLSSITWSQWIFNFSRHLCTLSLVF